MSCVFGVELVVPHLFARRQHQISSVVSSFFVQRRKIVADHSNFWVTSVGFVDGRKHSLSQSQPLPGPR